MNNQIIVFTSNTSWYLYNFQLQKILHFKKLGYQIFCIAPKDQYSQKLADNGLEYCPVAMNNHGLNPLQDYKTYKQYKNYYQQIKPSIICSYTIKPNIYSTIAAGKIGVKVINNISGLGAVFVQGGLLAKLVINMYRYAMQYSSHIFFQNKENLQLLCSQVKIKSFSLLPGSGVDTNKFKPIAIAKTTDKTTFLLVARLLWDKGLKEYFEAAKSVYQNHKNVEFQLLGSFCEGKYCVPQQTIQSWHKEPYFNYLGSTDDVRKYLTKADCVVLPSSYSEGTPRSLLEAASMAKPIITTDAAGCRNVVEDGITGFLCQVKSAIDLADKMQKFIDLSNDEKQKMGQLGREKIVKEFDVNLVIEQYQKIIEKFNG